MKFWFDFIDLSCYSKDRQILRYCLYIKLWPNIWTERTGLLPPDAFYRLKMANKMRLRLGLCPGPRWGAYNAPPDALVGLRGLSCHSNKTESVSLRKSARDRWLTNRAYSSAITQWQTFLRVFTYKMAAKINRHRRVTVTLYAYICHMIIALYKSTFTIPYHTIHTAWRTETCRCAITQTKWSNGVCTSVTQSQPDDAAVVMTS